MSGQLSIVHMESSLLVSFPLSELDSLLFSVWKKANFENNLKLKEKYQ